MKADDLDGVSDPSKLSESDFAPGTKWTNAGWTRSNYDHIALNSKAEFTDVPSTDIIFDGQVTIGALNGTVTLNKDDIKKGNKILIAAIQNRSNYHKDLNATTIMSIGKFQTVPFKINDKVIGNLDVVRTDNGESDIVLTVTTDSTYSTNPTGNYIIRNWAYNYNIPYDSAQYADYQMGKLFKLYEITPTNIYKSTYNDPVEEPFSSNTENPKVDARFNNVYNWYIFPFSEINPENKTAEYNDTGNLSDSLFSKPFVHIYKRFSSQKITDLYQSSDGYYPIFNKNGQIVGLFQYWRSGLKVKKLDDNLPQDKIIDQTPMDTTGYSIVTDSSGKPTGEIYYCIKVSPEAVKIADNDYLEEVKHNSLGYNITDKNDKDAILKKNLECIHKFKNLPIESIFNVSAYPTSTNEALFMRVTDLTPGFNNVTDQGLNQPNGTTFNADLYKFAQVQYIDSSNKDTQVANDSIMGTKNNATNYMLNIPKGYILDTKSGKNKDGTQYKWSADKKSIAYTFNEDQKLNDANPINIYITHGTHNTNDNSGRSTRTIQYTGLPDNLKPKDNVQTVLFKRSGVTDDVSGETTYGDWQPQAGNGHYTAVPSPTFAGYKPDQEVIPDTAATPNKNETVTVNYSRTNQNAKLTVHDDTANTDLNDYAENSTGLYQDQINFKTAPSAVEQELKDKGYNIVSDSFKGSPTYNADDSKNNFVIHVTHKIVPVTPDQPKTPTDVIPDTKQHYPTGVDTNDLNKDVQRSIFYKYEDNTQAEPTVVQKAHFGRTVKVDAVTQKIVDNGTWATKDNYPEVATKSIDGYTPDKTKVNSATPSMTTNQDQTVVYHANDEDAAITYIDDTTGKVLKTDTQKAKYKQTIKFATDPNTQIQTYKDQGYVLVSSDWKDGSTYQTDPTKNKFTVHLKHGTSTVTPDKPKKSTDIIPGTKQHYPTGVDANDLNQPQQRQITYTYSDSKKQASPTVTQKVTFHRTATVDNVTGKTTYTDWTTSDQYPEVKSPAIEGYTPDKSNVSATKPELNQKQDVAVIYNPNPEQVDVIAQDNTGKQLSKSTLHGNYNTDYSATTPVIKGYHLIKMPDNTHGTYKIHNDPVIYIYAPDSNSVPEQTDGTPKPDKSSYPNDLTPAKRSNKLPETGSTNLVSDLNSVANNITHALQHLLH